MSTIRILSREDTKKLLSMPMILEAVEQAYLQKNTGKGDIWPMVFHEFEHGVSDLDIKSGNLDTDGIYGLKVVSWYGKNPAKGLPALHGTSMIFDLATGAPKALMNAGAITDYRTGAAGAVGAKYLARKDSRHVVLAGCGALAPYLIAATLIALPQIEKVTIINPRTPAHAPERLGSITAKVDALMENIARTAEITASSDIPATVGAADIILTATPAYQPIIEDTWVKPGTHISCVGADLSGKQEIASDILARARVFGDDSAQCLSVGECEVPYKEGKIKGLQSEIGAVIAGTATGRVQDSDVTVFDSTGIALQDLASGAKLLKKAEEMHIGTVVEL